MTAKALRNTAKRQLKTSLAAAALWALSSPAWALSLSEISLNSMLHEPFNATISLRNFDPIEIDRVSVELAGDLMQSNYNGSNYLSQALTATLKNTRRGTVIELKSTAAIDEPFLRFAVQLNAREGVIMRQYEVLLDPPASFYDNPSKAVKQHIAKVPQLQTPKLQALKDSITITPQERAQGIEMASVPTQLSGTGIEEPQKLDAEERLFTETEMDLEEFLAALEQYNGEATAGTADEVPTASQTLKETVAATTPLNEQAVAEQPKRAALSPSTPATPIAAGRAKPDAAAIAKTTATFDVDDAAFANSSADTVARALMEYRDRARAGKRGGINPRTLVKMSKNSVRRISPAPSE